MTSQEYVAGLFDLTGHVGIITGASRGLGLGQAKVLTDAGAKVYNFDIAPHSDEETIREGSLIDVICDVTDYEKVKKEVEAIAGQEGHLDFLINNAGITYKSRAEEFPEDRLDKIREDLEQLAEERRPLYRKRKMGKEEEQEESSKQIEQLTAAMRELRRERNLCRRIQEDIPRVQGCWEEAKAGLERKRQREQAKQKMAKNKGRRVQR